MPGMQYPFPIAGSGDGQHRRKSTGTAMRKVKHFLKVKIYGGPKKPIQYGHEKPVYDFLKQGTILSRRQSFA
jgi:hypothetical protein